MKKLLPFLMLAVILMAGCNSGSDQKSGAANDTSAVAAEQIMVDVATSGATEKKTLNNVDSATAKLWIENYKKARATPGMVVGNVSYVFNKRMVNKILAYLSKEGGDVDGIRFYLAKKSTIDAETMLLLVSTKTGASADKHTDYYEHDKLLFDTARIVTLRINKKGTDPGAVLYDKCPTCPDLENGCKLSKGALPRSYAEKMIQGFDGKNMNTDAIWLPLSLFKNMAREKSFDGIRVYFGTYPDGTHTPPNQPSYAGRNTIVLTYIDKNGVDDFNCTLGTEKSEVVTMDDGGSAGPPQNNGSLCPNNCD